MSDGYNLCTTGLETKLALLKGADLMKFAEKVLDWDLSTMEWILFLVFFNPQDNKNKMVSISKTTLALLSHMPKMHMTPSSPSSMPATKPTMKWQFVSFKDDPKELVKLHIGDDDPFILVWLYTIELVIQSNGT